MQRTWPVKVALAAALTLAGVGCGTDTPPMASVHVRPVASSSSTTTSTTTTTTSSTTTSTTVAPTTTTIAAPVVPVTDPPPPPAPEPAPVAPGPVSGADSWPSVAWLHQLAACESGDTNAWRTGWFGIEAGYPIGGLSWDDQVAWVRRILGETGMSAWGSYPSCVGDPY